MFAPGIRTAFALTASLLLLGIASGCGDGSESSDFTDRTEPGATATTGSTGPTNATGHAGATGQEAVGEPSGDGGQPDGTAGDKKERGHNPASAKDKKKKAPDDAISDRPGGPKPPGKPQPVK